MYKEENSMMKVEIKRLRELNDQNQETLQERAKEIFELSNSLKKFTSKLDIVEREAREIQTNLSFKNDHFTTTMDEILYNKIHKKLKKITKLMKKASSNVSNYHPMPFNEVMDMIQGMFIKKS